jgi:hypothetical protein
MINSRIGKNNKVLLLEIQTLAVANFSTTDSFGKEIKGSALSLHFYTISGPLPHINALKV